MMREIYYRRNILKFLFFFILFSISLSSSILSAEDQPPSIGTITPSSGQSLPGEQVFFTTTYSDPNGWWNLKLCRLIINTGMVGANCFNGYYNQNINKLYLKNNENTQWLGGFTPGVNQIIENDYVKLDCSKTVVTSSGNTTSIKWAVTFKESFAGKTYNTYLFAKDDTDAKTKWEQKGTWEVKGGAPQDNLPKVGSITPSSGQSLPGEEVFFTTTYSDSNGWRNLKICRLMINTEVIGRKCFNGYYNQNGNRLYLKNNDNTKWLGSFTPGVNQIIENDYAKLDCSKTTVTGSGNTITIKWAVTFKESFAGKTYNTYLFAKDDTDAKTKWEEKGIWEVLTGDIISPTGTIKIDNGSNYTNSTSVILNLSAQDNEGGSGLSKMQFSNDSTTWSALEPYLATKSWELTSGDGQKTVYVRFQDAAGNLSPPFSDSIILDTTPPVPPAIDPVTSPTDVNTQTITGTKSQDTVTIIITSLQATLGPVTYPTSTTWSSKATLQEGDNNSQVLAEDAAGNQSSPAVEVTIVLDRGGPDPPTVDPVTTPTNVAAQTITGGKSEDAEEIKITSPEATLPPVTYPTSTTWSSTATLQEGNNNFEVLAKDAIGNQSSPVEFAIVLDTTPTQITGVTPVDGSSFYEDDTISIFPTVNDQDPSPLEYQFLIDGIIKQAWSNSSSYGWTPSSQDIGVCNIKVQVRDTGGEDTIETEVYVFRKPLLP